jgi:hypothetical protein
MIGLTIALICLFVFFNKCTARANGSDFCKL